jgi:hypothetical protein
MNGRLKSLFGLFLLALAFLAPQGAEAANRFLTCTVTCTITAIDTTIWGSTSGGTGASVPGTGDSVILDAATCVGGVTCTATFGSGYNPTWISLDMSACTASTSGCILDANTNGNTITLTNSGNAYINTGSGTRTLSGGTWVLSGNAASWNIASTGTVTNAPSINYSGSGGTTRRVFISAGTKTYGTLTIASSTSAFNFAQGAATIGTLTIAPNNRIYAQSGTTIIVTTLTNLTGSSSAQTIFTADNPQFAGPIFSSANNWTCTWCGFSGMNFTGGGTFSATSSADYGANSGITITAPSGGSCPGRIIGGENKFQSPIPTRDRKTSVC